MDHPFRARMIGLICIAPLVAATACAPDKSGGEDSLEGETVRVIIPSEAGGGFDTTMRQIQPDLEDKLGATLAVENQEGGNFAIGTQAAINAKQDCTTVLFHGVPHLPFSYLTQKVDYTAKDLAPLAGLTVEPGVFRVQNDSPWKSLQDMVDAAKKDPGKVAVSVSGKTSNNYVAMLALEEATGADFNIVPFDGGDPARTALIAGDVQATHAGVFNSLSIDKETRALAVSQDENEFPESTDDAPTANEALGVDLPPNGSNYALWVPKGCKADHPKRYELLVEAVTSATKDKDYLARLKKLGAEKSVEVLSAEELDQLTQESVAEIEAVLKEDPKAFE